MAKELRLWHRQKAKGEGPTAYEYFTEYISCAPNRSCEKVAEITGREPTTIQQLCAEYEWVKRAKAYDEYLIQVQQKAVENTVKKKAEKWAERQLWYKEEEFELGKLLLARIKEMLAVPLFKTEEHSLEVINGELVSVTKEVHPFRWTGNTISNYIKTLSEVMRLSLSMPTSNNQVTVKVDLTNPDTRLSYARAALEEHKKRVDSLVADTMADNPGLDKEEVKAQLLQQIPIWTSEAWDVPVEQLTLGDGDGLVETPIQATGGQGVN